MDFMTKVKALVTVLTESAKAQTVLFSTAGVLAIGGLGVGGFNLYEYYYGPEAVVVAEADTESTQTQSTELLADASDTQKESEVSETETETETETEKGPMLVKLVGSSIEKDLKIKIQNEEERNVSGEEFCITVTPDKKNAKTSVYNDHDNDGIIYITDISGGDYIVALEEIEGYYTNDKSIKVKVKEQIEYVKVDVKDEIKTEDEVSPEEDAESKKENEVEAEIKDTVNYVGESVTQAKDTVNASAIDKNQYMTVKASVGANDTPVTVPTSTVAPAMSFSYHNMLRVRLGIREGILVATGNNEIPALISETNTSQIPGSTTESGNTQSTESTQKPEGSTGTGDSETPEGSTESTQKPEATTPSAPAPAPTATLAMPKNVKLFVSTREAANTVKLEVAVNDTAAIVKTAEIKWTVEEDTTGGIRVIRDEANPAKATVSSANATTTGTAVVKAEIPYEVSGKKESVTLKCEVKVEKETYDGDGTIALTDNTGSVLYLDSACQKTATIADLLEKNVTVFYKNPQYLGWQTINGNLYYYDSNYKPVTGQQIIGGLTYSFGTDGALLVNKTANGIDVSKWQPNVDWNTVKASGIEFVIIRVGYRGSSTGVLVEDPYFKQHIAGASKAGLKIGVYFFSQAITKAEAVEEASMALELTKGYNLTYPIFIDTERVNGGRANGLDKTTRTEVVDAFCKTIQSAGKKAGIYANKSWFYNQLNTSGLEKNYYIWIAQYNTECNYTGKYQMWQYSETGRVPGISGNVDLNISYMN